MAELDQLLLEHGASPLTVGRRLVVDRMLLVREPEVRTQVAAASEAGLRDDEVQSVEDSEQPRPWGAATPCVLPC